MMSFQVQMVRRSILFFLIIFVSGRMVTYGEEVTLHNKRFEVTIQKDAERIYFGKISDQVKKICFTPPSGSEVWRIRLKKKDWSTFELTSESPSGERIVHANADEVIATWKGVLSGEEAVFNVRVTGKIESDSQISTWRIEVTDVNPKYSVYEVDFPSLTLGQLTPDGKDDLLVFPSYGYRLIKKPQTYSFALPLSAEYPGGAQMQMMAFYAPDKSGLYIATYDSKGYYKGFSGKPSDDGKTIRCWITHYPEDRVVQGKSYSMPFDAVLGSFDGTWWAASKIYRQWALKQEWCSKGTLEKREEIPDWYKRLPVWQLVWSGWQEGPDHGKMVVEGGTPSGVLPVEDMIKMYKTDYPGLPVTIHLYGWMHPIKGKHTDSAFGEYFPPSIGEERLRDQIKKLHDADMRVVAYVQGWLCSKEIDWFKEAGHKYAVMNEDGRMNRYSQEEVELTWMCAGCSGWHDKLVEVCKELADYGVDGIYLDCFSATGPQCFDKTHGHPLGGGNYYSKGSREMMEKIRNAVHKTHPEIAFIGEGYNEISVGEIDGGFGAISMPYGGIPMFASVYHDYIMYYANSLRPDNYDKRLVRFLYAHSFINGAQLGWYAYIGGYQSLRDASPYATYLAGIRTAIAKKFLSFGEMVEPPLIVNDLPSVRTPSWHGNITKDDIEFPAVMHSAWKASDGTLGLVFINITDSMQKVRYKLDVAGYNMPASKGIEVTKLGLDKSEPLGKYPGGVVEREDSIGPMEVLVLEIKSFSAIGK